MSTTVEIVGTIDGETLHAKYHVSNVTNYLALLDHIRHDVWGFDLADFYVAITSTVTGFANTTPPIVCYMVAYGNRTENELSYVNSSYSFDTYLSTYHNQHRGEIYAVKEYPLS